MVLSWTTFRDRIKKLKLRRFGKLNFTYHGKLRHRSSSSTAAIYIDAMAAVDEGEKSLWPSAARLLCQRAAAAPQLALVGKI